jgi:hypothetical protein
MARVLNARRLWFDEWGFLAVLAAGFSPIPYKVFTITAGVLSMAFMPFVLASFIGRGARFLPGRDVDGLGGRGHGGETLSLGRLDGLVDGRSCSSS